MFSGRETFNKIAQLLVSPTFDPSQRAARICAVEKDIVLPIKGLLIVILIYYLYFSDWFDAKGYREEQLSIIRIYFLIYVGANILGALAIFTQQISLKWLQTLAGTMGLLDGLLLVGLTSITLGSDSMLYWIFPLVIIHNALAIPMAIPQLLLNFAVSFCYIAGDRIDKLVITLVTEKEKAEAIHRLFAENINKFAPEELRNENAIDRLIVLLLWAVCCYGIQMLFEKQKRAEAEATEFAVRQERLHTAGRLAAEIAHQIKNPLGIITNAAFCLQYAVREGKTSVDEQIEIIREEVERADCILTELMGYAQLAEGKVEKLNVVEELDQAIHEVLPPAAKYEVAVRRNFATSLPVLLMQRRQFNAIMVNLLQNAREAMHGKGGIEVVARFGAGDSIVIQVADTGPGIPPDKIDKIFEAYFTTRQKGTGLGLAIVKHNAEMYGGSVRVQSELGKGTKFVLEFPPRILMKLKP